VAITVEAVYENGVLGPTQPLLLKEHQRVQVTIEQAPSIAASTAGMIQWSGDPELLRRIAEDDEFGILESP
jgi:predicted DNA-binding antitoxin AbrB/MazE fold protein